ncbi:MAG: hypothetical protein ACUVWZ_10405 [Anaerolineae bacterium]
MKKLAFLVILALIAAVPAYAQLGETDNSSFVIQNLGTTTATISVTFYDEAGTEYTPNPLRTGVPNPFPLAPGAKQEIYMPAVPGLPDGRYSVVIESTEPIAVIANLLGTGATYYNGSYSGFNAGATTIYYPSTQYQYYNWNSLMSVQNTTASSITANLYIYNAAGTQVATDSKNIPAFASYHWDLETVGASLGLPAGLNGSAKVVCSGACVGTDNQTAAGGFTQSYNAFIAGDTTLYAPALYNNYYGWNGSLKVQNIGPTATNIDVIYYIEGGAVCDPPAENIQPGQALFHYLPAKWPTWGCPSAANKIIGAVVTSDGQDIAGVVNAALPGGQAQTYGAFASADGAGTVGLPVIMNNYYKWDTAFVCQNLDPTNNATVTYSYSGIGCPAGPQYPSCTYTLTPGEAKSVYQPADLDATTGLFAVTVTATGAPIACIANETLPAARGRPGPGDWSMSYNGFGQ